jgi:hypothetical protein
MVSSEVDKTFRELLKNFTAFSRFTDKFHTPLSASHWFCAADRLALCIPLSAKLFHTPLAVATTRSPTTSSELMKMGERVRRATRHLASTNSPMATASMKVHVKLDGRRQARP